MGKLVLKYLGDDFLGMPVYEDKEGNLLKDVNLGRGEMALHTVYDIDGDPDVEFSKIGKYKGLEIVITGRDDEPTREEKFLYQMLGRLKMDCDYFLGNGCGYEKHLWAGNVNDQIKEMRRLYALLEEGKKPEWLTSDDISSYEKLMVR